MASSQSVLDLSRISRRFSASSTCRKLEVPVDADCSANQAIRRESLVNLAWVRPSLKIADAFEGSPSKLKARKAAASALIAREYSVCITLEISASLLPSNRILVAIGSISETEKA